MIIGFVIKSIDGEFLSEERHWREHLRPEEAFVHPTESAKEIMAISNTWSTRPLVIIPAVFDCGKVTVTGHAMEASAIQG